MSHPPIHGGSQGRVMLSAVLTLGLVVFEVVAGWRAHSLALLTDAAHNLTDVLALALSGYALKLAERPPHAGKTFGYHRVGILVAVFNSASLVVIAAGIFHEAYQRLQQPTSVVAEMLVGVGGVAFVVNVLTAWLVSQGHRHDLNLRSAYLHLLGDILSTLGAVVAGIGIWLTGLDWLDPAASIVIGLLILWNAWLIFSESLDILLEGTPRDIDMSEMVRDLLGVPGVKGVHNLHVWSLSRNLGMLSAHVVTEDITLSAGAKIQSRINALLLAKYNIVHTTLQLECAGCEPDRLYCDITPTNAHHGAH